MELQSILTADYLDIIFDNRNKTYGGYELRRQYNKRAMKATVIVLSSLLLLLGAHTIASAFRSEENVTLQHHGGVILHDITPPPPPEPPKPPIEIEPPAAGPAPSAPTMINTPPVIVDADIVNHPPTVDELRDKVSGNVNSDGDGGNDAANSVIPGSGGGGSGPTGPVETAPVVSSEPVIYVDQMPEFDGNVTKYLSSNIRYPQMAQDAGISGRVTIRFVVNEDGSVSNVKVIRGIGGGCEEEAVRVIKGMPRWKPGKQGGKPMKVYMTLPVNFLKK